MKPLAHALLRDIRERTIETDHARDFLVFTVGEDFTNDIADRFINDPVSDADTVGYWTEVKEGK